jgi:hypothetical protein
MNIIALSDEKNMLVIKQFSPSSVIYSSTCKKHSHRPLLLRITVCSSCSVRDQSRTFKYSR